MIHEINPDIAAKQRRRNDAGRQWTVVQTEDWTREKIGQLYEWVGQRHSDLELQICRLQEKQNRLAFNLFELEECFYRLEARATRQSRTTPRKVQAPALKSLRRKWRRMDNQLRLLRQQHLLLGPLYYQSNIHSLELPMNDPFLLACWELAIGERPWLERRGQAT